MKKLFYFIIVSFLIISCHNYVKISFTNTSEENIYFASSCYTLDSISQINYYTENEIKAMNKNYNGEQAISLYSQTYPKQTKYISYPVGFGDEMEELERAVKMTCKGGDLNIFVIKESDLKSIPWDTIVKNNLYETLNYSPDELKKMKYKIKYISQKG